MRVTVRLFATLARGRPSESAVEVEEGATVNDVIRQIDVPEGQVTLIFVNNRHGGPETRLAEGDAVALVPPIGGG